MSIFFAHIYALHGMLIQGLLSYQRLLRSLSIVLAGNQTDSEQSKVRLARRRVNAYQLVLPLACRPDGGLSPRGRRIAAISHEDFKEVLNFARQRRYGSGAQRHRGIAFS
jgi:hypothetical protein